MDKSAGAINIPLNNDPPSSPQPSSGDLLNKFKQFTEKIKISLIAPSAQKTPQLLDTFPPSLRMTITLTDDGTEILIGEISEDKWPLVVETYPVYVMEVEGSDPLFEQYLRERNLELRKRRLAVKQGSLSQEHEMRSSFVAVNHQTTTKESQSTEPTPTTCQHLPLVVAGSESISDEEILLRDEIEMIQQQVAQPLSSLDASLTLLISDSGNGTGAQTFGRRDPPLAPEATPGPTKSKPTA
jgi:hypothetical protein